MPTQVISPAKVSGSAMLPFDKHRCQHLRGVIESAAELLPAQGPITAFAFVNTLQALEKLPFDEGLKLGSRLYHCQPYLSEEAYRQELACGRIQPADLVAVLLEDLGDRGDDLLGLLGTRFHLRLAMLEHPLRLAPEAELRWVIAETNALNEFRPEMPEPVRVAYLRATKSWLMNDVLTNNKQEKDHHSRLVETLLQQFDGRHVERWSEATWTEFSLNLLWQVCRQGAHGPALNHAPAGLTLRVRDVLLEITGDDADLLVHEILIRFCAGYLDQGQADWSMPYNHGRLWDSFVKYYGQSAVIVPKWMKPLRGELKRISEREMKPLDVIQESLKELGITEGEESAFIVESLLALRGWAGMVWQMETRPDRVPFPVEPGTLVEYLAVRLLCDRLAARSVASLAHVDGTLTELRHHRKRNQPAAGLNLEQRAFMVFQLAQVRGWQPDFVMSLNRVEWQLLIRELEEFSGVERRRIYHHAYERTYRCSALDALVVRTRLPLEVPSRPKLQAMFCLDAREESFRRHIEDVDPQAETFANAGFFNVPIQYRGVADAHYATHCPIVVHPTNWVVEEVAFTAEETHRRRALVRRALGAATRQFQVGTRRFASGAVLSAGVGVLASIPMVMSVLFPSLASRLQSSARGWVAPPRSTRLRLQRTDETAGPNNGGVGFSLEEMTNMCERCLRDTGLTRKFARLVFIFGHGSECLNNPHESVYHCGACSGSRGGPNARALCAMLNDVRVRGKLNSRGIEIPEETVFIGGLHNTCNDAIEYYDLDLVPSTHLADFRGAREVFEEACARNAHERCRRFASAPLRLSLFSAMRIVQRRSEDLAETRPEYGNCTNALCVVGRRGRTRGLFLDRRAFLMSYDATQDDANHTVLARILAAVIPVCEGINLQYTLSNIDSAGWGCGSKLPHNVTALLGVMDGSASDLRPGLPWQGCDIHEPMRLTFVIESTPPALFSIMERNELVRRIIANAWVHLALLDPQTGAMQVYRQGQFEPYHPRSHSLPEVNCWEEWYAGSREHLGFALRPSSLKEVAPC